jgi:hypothetical protein
VQACPQEPQFWLSVFRFVQEPEHKVWPAAQVILQLPWMQLCPLTQTFPQEPQLLLSDETLVHEPPHSC